MSTDFTHVFTSNPIIKTHESHPFVKWFTGIVDHADAHSDTQTIKVKDILCSIRDDIISFSAIRPLSSVFFVLTPANYCEFDKTAEFFQYYPYLADFFNQEGCDVCKAKYAVMLTVTNEMSRCAACLRLFCLKHSEKIENGVCDDCTTVN